MIKSIDEAIKLFILMDRKSQIEVVRYINAHEGIRYFLRCRYMWE